VSVRDEFGLTIRQRRWADYFIAGGNATQAAIEAGYSPHMARSIGHENTKKPQIQQYIKGRMEKEYKDRVLSAQEVLERLSDIAKGGITQKTGKGEEEKPPTFAEQTRALELLGKVHRLFVDRQDVTETGEITVKFEGELEEYSG